MKFDLLSKKDLVIISEKLNSGEYSFEYIMSLYEFSEDEIFSILNLVKQEVSQNVEAN